MPPKKKNTAKSPGRRRAESPRVVAAQVVRDVFESDDLFDDILNTNPGFAKLKPIDRRLVYHLAAGTIKYKRRLDVIARHFLKAKFDKLTKNIKAVLRVGVFQLSISDKIPPHAAVSETVKAARRLGHQGTASLVNAVLRRCIDQGNDVQFPSPRKEPLAYFADWYSYPDWLIAMLTEIGDEGAIEEFCRWGNREPEFCVRLNPVKTTEAELLATGRAEEVILAPIPLFPGYYQWLSESGPSANSKILRRGLATVQNPAAGLVITLLDPKPRERITDFFAAPGGKSTAIAERQLDQGYVFAIDKSTRRLARVDENKGRLGLKSILTMAGDMRTLPPNQVDRVLADVPCSALGTLPKSPDVRWKKTAEDILRLSVAQREYLTACAEHVKPGGTLVYATCTIAPRENHGVIRDFLINRPDFLLEHADKSVGGDFVDANGFLFTFPPRAGLDCIFAARLRRVR